MPTAYESIATTTLTTASATVDFTSISSAYTDLKVVFVGTVTTNGETLYYRFNSDTGTNYSITQVWANGGTDPVSTRRLSSAAQLSTTYAYSLHDTTPQMITFDIFSYAGSTNKTTLGTHAGDNNGVGGVDITAGLWRNTSAITSINIFASGGTTFKAGSTFSLYGILKA